MACNMKQETRCMGCQRCFRDACDDLPLDVANVEVCRGVHALHFEVMYGT